MLSLQVDFILKKINLFGLVLLYKKSRRMSTGNVEFWQTTGNDDAIDSLSQILPYESTRYAFESHFL